MSLFQEVAKKKYLEKKKQLHLKSFYRNTAHTSQFNNGVRNEEKTP